MRLVEVAAVLGAPSAAVAATCHASVGAALALGVALDTGHGARQNQAAAAACYRLAAAAGLPAGEFNYAAMLEDGAGVVRNSAEAALWYARAAAHGDARAAFALGQLYAAGRGVPRNPVMAHAWFGEAARVVPEARRLAEKMPRVRSTSIPAPDPAPAGGSGAARELVWRAPDAGSDVRYYVSIVTLDDGTPREIARAVTRLSATLAWLPRKGHFAWRVYAVSPARGDYAASVWQML